MYSANIFDVIDNNSESLSNEEILPVRSPSFQSRLMARLTPLSSLKRSVSVPHRSQNSSSTSPKPNKEKLCIPDFGLLPATPVTKYTAIPEGKSTPYNNLQQHEGAFRSIHFRPSKFVHRSKSHRTAGCVNEDKLSISLPEENWATNLSKLPNAALNRDNSPFKDPILTDLDSRIPDPVPPPRACPPWLKVALQKQKSIQSERFNTDANSDPKLSTIDAPDISISTATKLDPSFTSLQRQKSFSLEGSRICPVVQNGVKLSDTHYWLLAPPGSRCGDQIARDNENEYLNDNSGSSILRRGRSAVTLSMLNPFHGNSIARLKHQVSLATYDECEAVLIGANYNYEEALQRLLLELLSRHCFVPRAQCKQLLIEYNWDLEKAISKARSIWLSQVSESRVIQVKRPQRLNARRVTTQPLLPSPMEPKQFPPCYSPQKPQAEPMGLSKSEADVSPTFQTYRHDSHELT